MRASTSSSPRRRRTEQECWNLKQGWPTSIGFALERLIWVLCMTVVPDRPRAPRRRSEIVRANYNVPACHATRPRGAFPEPVSSCALRWVGLSRTGRPAGPPGDRGHRPGQPARAGAGRRGDDGSYRRDRDLSHVVAQAPCGRLTQMADIADAVTSCYATWRSTPSASTSTAAPCSAEARPRPTRL